MLIIKITARIPFEKTMFTAFSVVIYLLILAYSVSASAMVEMHDEQLSKVTGQALLQMNKVVGDDLDNGTQGITFYTAGLDALLDLNLNIEKLQLGCGGVNGVGCDLDIDDFSLGCITNSSGNCITLSPAPGTNQKVGAVNEGPQAGMKDFSIERPFFQFAIKNDGTKTLREVIGIRLGGENVSGPLSFGSLNTFSGYLNGEADVFLRGETDVAATCTSPDTCPNAGGRTRYSDASAFLGLNDANVLNLGIYRIFYRNLTIDYGGQSRENIAAEVFGNRVTQVPIEGLALADLVDDIVDDVSINRICALTIFGTCSFIIGDGLANALLPLLRGGVSDYIKGQLANGLNISPGELNDYVLPYNLKNIHQLDVATDLFGLSFQKESVRYPGYKRAMVAGWSMYAPDAFNLVIDDKVSNFVQGIAGSSNARDGNIVGLPAPYRNCWGSARFC